MWEISSLINSPEVKKVISYITSLELQEKLFPAKVVFIFFSVIFFIGVLYLLVRSTYLKEKFWQDFVEFFTWKPYGFIKIMKKWGKIQKRIVTGSESEYKLAIIEADDFLNSTLEKRGYTGKNFEERISKIEKTQLPNSEEILRAHKIRDSIVYDPDYRLDLDEAKKILKIYEEIIRNIETF